jgi:hypothetical protein
MQELSGLGALGANPAQIIPRKAGPAISRYVSCLKEKGLSKAFYLQDPRQEVVTEAHRRGDACYQQLNPAIYMSVKEVAKYHLDYTPSDAQVTELFAAAKAGREITLGGNRLSREDARHMVQTSLGHVEFAAQEAATRDVGRVHAQEVTPSPLTIGADEYNRRLRTHDQGVQAGTTVRVLRQEDVVSPEEQRRIAARVAAEAAAAARARGPLVSCPRGTPMEQCLADAARRRRAAKPSFPWLWVGLGSIAFLGLVGGLAARSGRARAHEPA